MNINKIYAREQGHAFDAMFRDPSAIYRGTPFWAWNTILDVAQLCRQPYQPHPRRHLPG